MKRAKPWVLAAALTAGCTCLLPACKKETPHLMGTIDAPLYEEKAPTLVQKAMDDAGLFHEHDIMSDELNKVSVFGIDEADTIPTEGYGVVVLKGIISTNFPQIRNVRQPMASYDAQTGSLWLTSSAMEGSGVRVELLYQIRFSDNDSAYIAHVVDPFDVQQLLCQRISYTIDGNQVSLLDGQRTVATATNTVTDMGGFDDEQPLWIGEQLWYDVSGGSPRLSFTPGVKFTTGLVLTYDDMPTLSAPLSIGSDGQLTIGEIE